MGEFWPESPKAGLCLMSLLRQPLVFALFLFVAAKADAASYGTGSLISSDVVVSDAQGKSVSLLELFAKQPGKVNVLFIFGGGDMGSGQPGHLWCQDSFEDTHILRTLHGKFKNKDIGFVAIAAAPVYHSKYLGSKERVFLDAPDNSADFRVARQSFVKSTLKARQLGILPFEPQFDFRFALMQNPAPEFRPGLGFGKQQSWHGAFRAADETQFYGVPSFWLVDDEGNVLASPFRGNVYHPHGGEMRIRYTYADVELALRTAQHAVLKVD